jgi:hypothetical protein
MNPKPHSRRCLALLLAGLCASPAFAADAPSVTENLLPQLPPQFEQIVAQAQMEAERFFVLGDGFDMAAGGELGSERVVKGAPYCADAVHESVQWLPDGQGGAPNRIVRQQSTRLCRDGEGRTRQEVDRGGRKIVYLRDPAARESWVLDPERKTARRLGLASDIRVRVPDTDSPAWREYGEHMREFGRQMAERARNGTMGTAPTPPVPPLPPMPPQPVIVSPADAGASGAQRSEVRVLRTNRDGESPEWALPPMAIQWRAGSLAPRGAGSVSPLGAKDVEGVRANGERTSWVIEAGKLGNEKPIQITREVWTSPDLMVTVASRDFDPRSGETNYRLKNLKRGEPDAALMRVPADFSKPTRPSPRASGAAG